MLYTSREGTSSTGSGGKSSGQQMLTCWQGLLDKLGNCTVSVFHGVSSGSNLLCACDGVMVIVVW